MSNMTGDMWVSSPINHVTSVFSCCSNGPVEGAYGPQHSPVSRSDASTEDAELSAALAHQHHLAMQVSTASLKFDNCTVYITSCTQLRAILQYDDGVGLFGWDWRGARVHANVQTPIGRCNFVSPSCYERTPTTIKMLRWMLLDNK